MLAVWLPLSWKLQVDPQRSYSTGPPLALAAVPRSNDEDLHMNCSAGTLICIVPLLLSLLTSPVHRHVSQGPPLEVVVFLLGSNVGT